MIAFEDRRIGHVTTPDEVARLLVDWAVSSKDSVVLDVGTGEGVFTFESYRRLTELGCSSQQALASLHGAERNAPIFALFCRDACERLGAPPPNVRHADLFDVTFPAVDAIVGNPPYVGRLHLTEIDHIRSRALPLLGMPVRLGRLSDLYCYFLIYAARFLRSHGRMAVVLSSSWMDADYGVGFKHWLLSEFDIRAVVAFERRLFKTALVKSVLLMAERKAAPGAPPGQRVHFVRLRGDLDGLSGDVLTQGRIPASVAKVSSVPQSRLDPYHGWSVYLKNPDVYFALIDTGKLAELKAIAESRIGLQTLAGGFYIMNAEQVASRGVEPDFLAPLAFSPRDVKGPILAHGAEPRYHLFTCDRTLDELEGTVAREHIRWGERALVQVRGAGGWRVQGYPNAPRLMKARRKPWYNIRSEVERRGRWPMLVPRRVYERFVVVWNQAGFVANEDFIEVRPRRAEDLVPTLAAVGSSVGEFMVRCSAQIYGGGIFNLNPDHLRFLPVLDVRALGDAERLLIEDAYWHYVARPDDRTALDRAMLGALGLPMGLTELYDALEELRALATVSKEHQCLRRGIQGGHTFTQDPVA